MARPKRNSSVLQTAEHRLSGMKLIDPKLDLGGGCTTQNVEAKIKAVRKVLTDYNAQLTALDAMANELERAEQALNYLSIKVLPGVATRYDKESDQYEMVGGVKPSEKKRKRRQNAKLVAV
ncbi:MAG: hypothetical protein ACFB0D_23125 [Phormidesmis sp.]